ncbi:hypothetical protein, conserved [Plasmodium gonderi]|uniref:tRNA pseudouridine(55) synthase n=1 Tax=Plasmodium gonderi TaxID=77519 RepID=A0A1Y1JQS4_PLAGO|nr:hypothetical protein, conserved [Plasmodium gonderi]GAW83192.1 hypothetical protein, conserved [Plasmodium gonderi]
MENICYRCSLSEETLNDHDYLFFDEYFLNDYNHDVSNVKEKKKSKLFLDNNKKRFLKYIEDQNINTIGEHLQDVYTKAYKNFYLCKMCSGLHNIDLILFYNKNSCFHHNVKRENIPITANEETIINSVFKNTKNMFDTLLNNIDIVFFYLYLHKTKQILCDTQIVTLDTFNYNYKNIKEHIIMNIKLGSNNFLKKQIHKTFVYIFVYLYLTFYNKICDSVTLTDDKAEFIINLYKKTVLIFSANTDEKIERKNNQSNEIAYKSKNKKHRFLHKKKRIINRNDASSAAGKEPEILYSDRDYYNTHDSDDLTKNEEETQQTEKKMNGKIASDKIENNELAISNPVTTFDIYVSLNNLCICGYYNKYNKEMSQTKWFVNNNVSLSALSVEECIFQIFKNAFSSSTCTFMASGREDKDVRMMNIGRPFVFVLKETKFSFLNFYLLFSKLKRMNLADTYSSGKTSEIKTVEQINFLIQHRNDKDNNLLTNNLSEFNQDNAPPQVINDSYALINKKDVISLYDINCHKELVKQAKDKIMQEQRIYDFHVACNYNKELEVLLSDELVLEEYQKQFVKNDKIEDINKIGKNEDINKIGKNEDINKIDIVKDINKVGKTEDINKIDKTEDINKVDKTEDINKIDIIVANLPNNTQEYFQNSNKDNLNGCLSTNTTLHSSTLKNPTTQNNKPCYNINNLVDVKFSNVAFSTNYGLIKKIMKYGEDRKKAYKCIIYHSSPMTKEKIQKINQDVLNYHKNDDIYIISIMQKTPIRVLHRRSLIKRERKIFEFNLVFIHEHFSLLYLLAQSGMYIKEFVNGDRGRTFPNLKYFFGEDAFVNILNLDVSSFLYDLDGE